MFSENGDVEELGFGALWEGVRVVPKVAVMPFDGGRSGKEGPSLEQLGHDSRGWTGDCQGATTTGETEARERCARTRHYQSQVQSHPTLRPGPLGEGQHTNMKRWGHPGPALQGAWEEIKQGAKPVRSPRQEAWSLNLRTRHSVTREKTAFPAEVTRVQPGKTYLVTG